MTFTLCSNKGEDVARKKEDKFVMPSDEEDEVGCQFASRVCLQASMSENVYSYGSDSQNFSTRSVQRK